MLFCDYFEEWVNLYKEGSVRPVTLKKIHIDSSMVKNFNSRP